MDFISNSQTQREEILRFIGINSVEELFSHIPSHLRLKAPLQDDGLSEFDGKQLIKEIAKKNTFLSYKSYLGGGAYEHHIPSIVSSICSKGEFLTSYTPYQAEASQGMLQAIFEFQTAIATLTGMDVANASLYDGASACAEACLMAARIQEKSRILIAENLNPHYQKVIQQYIELQNIHIEKIPFLPSGNIDLEAIRSSMNHETAALIIQSPNFFGIIEEMQKIAAIVAEQNALLIVSANPLAYGLYEPCGSLGAHIAVGDCQPFGIPLQFGGPYCGYLACKKEFVRQMPGRIVGQTKDAIGQRGFVLTLQAREQHIRREKATSNICTNQALTALATLISLVWYGKEGVQKLALTNFQRAAYLQYHLSQISTFEVMKGWPIFNEFAVKVKKPLDDALDLFRRHKIEPGISLKKFFPQMENSLLIAVTETKSLKDLNDYIEIAKML